MKQFTEQRDYSQEVYHHTTETMAESKALVKMHTSTDVPGPGQYSLPELPSLAQAPKITGRALPFAVPKPFAYNAQPDMGRKFQPLRASNSGDLIFGRNFKSGIDSISFILMCKFFLLVSRYRFRHSLSLGIRSYY